MIAPLLARGILPLALIGLVSSQLLLADAHALRILTLAGVTALNIAGLQMIFGQLGALSLAQAGFFALGALATALLGRAGYDAALTLPVSIIAPALLAALLALGLRRLHSHHLALATLAFGQAIWIGLAQGLPLLGAPDGLAGVPGLSFFGLEIAAGRPLASVVWVCAAFVGVMAAWIASGANGAGLALVRERPRAAAAMGVDRERLLFAGFVWSALCGGAAGAFQAHTLGLVSSALADYSVVITLLAALVIGGRHSVAGGMLAGAALLLLPEWVPAFAPYVPFATAALFLLTVISTPAGLAGWLRRQGGEFEETSERRRTVAPTPRLTHAKLEISGVVKLYGGVRALDGVGLAVEPGGILGLIGPNGSGKTTLLDVASGFVVPDAGEVRLDGIAIHGRPPARIAKLGLSRTFQTGELVAGLTALDNVALALVGRNVNMTATLLDWRRDRTWEAARERAAGALALAGASSTERELAGALPHGMRRRVELARALVHEPRIVLLDEPASGLPENQLDDLSRFLREVAERGVGMLIAEHRLPFLLRLASRIACLDQGKLIALGPPAEVRNDPRVLAAYFTAADDAA
jgi:branched-chain amino acid transport system permease protein